MTFRLNFDFGHLSNYFILSATLAASFCLLKQFVFPPWCLLHGRQYCFLTGCMDGTVYLQFYVCTVATKTFENIVVVKDLADWLV